MAYTKIADAAVQPETVTVEINTSDGPVTIEVPAPGRLLETGHWVAPDEVAVELDTGEFVALACVGASRDYASQTIYLTTTARLLDAEGGTATDQGQEPAHIATSWMHGATKPQIALAGGIDALRRDCMLASLGEPLQALDGEGNPVLALPVEMRNQVSIRSALASAAQIGAAFSNHDPL